MYDMKERKLGWVRDPVDKRDHGMRQFFMVRNINVPAFVDLRQWCSDVEDQGQAGSCTGNATAGALEFLEIRNGKPNSGIVQKSRLFPYYNGRGWWYKRQDSGACIRDVIKGVAKYGCCNETVWPYDIRLVTRTPSRAAYTDGQRNRITAYAKLTGGTALDTLDNIRETLANGFPVVFGFDCFDNVLSAACSVDGVVKVPAKTEVIQGGHAVLAVGYDDAKQEIIFRNSWGTKWGDKGYGRLPYWYVLNGHATDFWVIQAQAPPEAGLWEELKGTWHWFKTMRRVG